MNVFAWILIVWLGLGGIASVYMIGRPRRPETPGGAIAGLVLSALLIVLVALAAHS